MATSYSQMNQNENSLFDLYTYENIENGNITFERDLGVYATTNITSYTDLYCVLTCLLWSQSIIEFVPSVMVECSVNIISESTVIHIPVLEEESQCEFNTKSDMFANRFKYSDVIKYEALQNYTYGGLEVGFLEVIDIIESSCSLNSISDIEATPNRLVEETLNIMSISQFESTPVVTKQTELSITSSAILTAHMVFRRKEKKKIKATINKKYKCEVVI